MVITNDPDCAVKTIAKYTCDEGFVPEGDTIRCCVGDGIDAPTPFLMADWTGSAPTCVRKLHLVLSGCFIMFWYINMTKFFDGKLTVLVVIRVINYIIAVVPVPVTTFLTYQVCSRS